MEIAFLTPKRYQGHPRPFYVGVPLGKSTPTLPHHRRQQRKLETAEHGILFYLLTELYK